ncbi:hypothetical protein ACFWVC_18635 [Streptomyces sp. NPDC058691]|uniref:hypothetical protein n=1 Tax=Streptomyces sp. NPDC058691 TaxID=3346601 RepID=UPI003654C95C
MLSLRVALGSRPAVLARRLLVVAAAAGTGFLLLATLGHALTHTGDTSRGLIRLAWCAVPFAATVHLSVFVARTEPSGRLHAGLSAAGLGRHGLPLLGAATTALSTGLGVVLALLVFLHLRGDLPGSPLSGAAAGPLGEDRPLPVVGALTLLALVPVVSAVATAHCLRAPRTPATDEAAVRMPPTGLPWGAALTTIGLAIEITAAHDARRAAPGTLFPLPGGLGGIAPAVAGGWILIAIGLVLAMPGLLHECGRLLASCRPTALRLLAGRALQEEAPRIGRPLGVLCAVCAAGLATTARLDAGAQPLGPLTVLGATLVAVAATATALTAAVDAKRARRPSTAALTRLGAPASLLRSAATLRTATALVLVAPVIWLVSHLGTLPLP